MSQMQKIHDHLDGNYWQMTNGRERQKRTNDEAFDRRDVKQGAFARQDEKQDEKQWNNNRRNDDRSTSYSYDYRTQVRQQPYTDTRYDFKDHSNEKTVELLERIARQQEHVLRDIASLKEGAEQQKAAWATYFPKLTTENDDPLLQRPVTMSTFMRFLMHFEENVSELRQSVDNIRASQPLDKGPLLVAAKAEASESNNNDNNSVVEEDKDVQEKKNCATQLLLLSGVEAPTIAQSLSKFEPKTCVWRWRAKTMQKQELLPSEALSLSVEDAYKQYISAGHIDRTRKTFEQETLYINFDSRQGTFERQPVVFERYLCNV